MLKRLTRHGNSLALVIDRSILEPLGIDADTPLEISTGGKVLIVSPVRDAGRRKIREGPGKGEPEIRSRPRAPRGMIHAP